MLHGVTGRLDGAHTLFPLTASEARPLLPPHSQAMLLQGRGGAGLRAPAPVSGAGEGGRRGGSARSGSSGAIPEASAPPPTPAAVALQRREASAPLPAADRPPPAPAGPLLSGGSAKLTASAGHRARGGGVRSEHKKEPALLRPRARPSLGCERARRLRGRRRPSSPSQAPAADVRRLSTGFQTGAAVERAPRGERAQGAAGPRGRGSRLEKARRAGRRLRFARRRSEPRDSGCWAGVGLGILSGPRAPSPQRGLRAATPRPPPAAGPAAASSAARTPAAGSAGCGRAWERASASRQGLLPGLCCCPNGGGRPARLRRLQGPFRGEDGFREFRTGPAARLPVRGGNASRRRGALQGRPCPPPAPCRCPTLA